MTTEITIHDVNILYERFIIWTRKDGSKYGQYTVKTETGDQITFYVPTDFRLPKLTTTEYLNCSH